MNKVCVVGSINMDMVTTTDYIPKLGETIQGKGFASYPGGKGANQAVAAARLGCSVSMIGCVGKDVFGEVMVKNFQNDKINAEGVFISNEKNTGTATILVCRGDNFIILDAGANGDVLPDKIEEFKSVIESADVILLQNEIPVEANEKVFEFAKGKIIYNPAPSLKDPPLFLYKTDILILNEHEISDVLSISIKDKKDAKKAALELVKKGVKNVIVTLGEQGAVYTEEENAFEIDAIKVENVVDTTAAGDCFCGAVAKIIANGGDIHNAVKYATLASSVAITVSGAQPSLPTKEMLGE